MQALEKILEEINQEKLKHWDSSERLDTDKLIGWCFDKCIDIIRKHMNDGWIPVEKFGLPTSNEHDFRFWITIRYTTGFRHTIKAKWDYFDKCFVHQNGKKILHDVIAYKYYSTPEPYRPERRTKP